MGYMRGPIESSVGRQDSIMTDRSETRRFILTAAILASLAVHVPLIVGLVTLLPHTEDTLEEPLTFDSIDLVEEPEEPEQDPQFVSLDRPEKETEAPEKDFLLDRFNQKVDPQKQTVRKRDTRSVRRPSPVNKPRRPTPATKPTATPSQARPAPSDGVQNPTKEATTAETEDTQRDSGQRAIEARADDNTREAGETRDNDQLPPSDEESGQAAELNPDQILPNMENTPALPGGGGPADYLDVAEGDKDLVNRKRFRYWAFFDRMKAAVARQWRPNEVYMRNDPRRQVYGVEDRLTILKVILNGDGSLRSLFVEKPSGVPFLDQEAMRAFRAASPFPNPPEAIKDETGAVSLRFGFFLDIKSRGSRIIRFRR